MKMVLLISQKQALEVDPKVVLMMQYIHQDMIQLQYPWMLQTVGSCQSAYQRTKKTTFLILQDLQFIHVSR